MPPQSSQSCAAPKSKHPERVLPWPWIEIDFPSFRPSNSLACGFPRCFFDTRCHLRRTGLDLLFPSLYDSVLLFLDLPPGNPGCPWSSPESFKPPQPAPPIRKKNAFCSLKEIRHEDPKHLPATQKVERPLVNYGWFPVLGISSLYLEQSLQVFHQKKGWTLALRLDSLSL